MSLARAASRVGALCSTRAALPTLEALRGAPSEALRAAWPAGPTRGFASEPAPEGDDEREIGNEKVHALVDQILELSILEFSDMSKLIGKRLGMPDMSMMPMGMPMGMPAAVPAGAAEAEAPVVEEKTSFALKLDGFEASSKIKVIKEVRAITELGLKEAKDLVEGAPCVVKPGLTKDEAEALKKKLEDVGAKVSLE